MRENIGVLICEIIKKNRWDIGIRKRMGSIRVLIIIKALKREKLRREGVGKKIG